MMSTRKSSSHVLAVASCSIFLNVLFAINYVYVGKNSSFGNEQGLSWTRRAAAEAETAASINCSGHGRAYLDGLLIDGHPICECHLCYSGPDCSEFSPVCDANADSGDPLFLEPFWMDHAESSAFLVAGWHRMSYSFIDTNFISTELERTIRVVHRAIGNAVTDGKYIVFGTGSTQLLDAAVHALSHNSSSPARVVASVPYYTLYEKQVEFFDSRDSTFQGDATIWKNNSDATADIIEFVTSPNNPDGQMNEPILNGSNVKTIYDRAYYWPHFTAIPEADNEDLSIFTISKLTGHAGSRFGWALIKDREEYERMMTFLQLNLIGVSKDTQLRALKLLRVVLEDGGREIFEFGYKTMKKRWERLRDTFSLSNRFSLQKNPSHYCNYLQRVREPTPAYAWVKCEREEHKSCYEVMRSANIVGREGNVFRADDRYVRLSVIRNEDDFNLLIYHLHRLVREEDRWALIKDQEVHERMAEYIDFKGFPTESSQAPGQLQYCNSLHKARDPSVRRKKTDCYEVMISAGIIRRRGNIFRADDRYVQLRLIRSEDGFDILLDQFIQVIQRGRPADMQPEGINCSINPYSIW